MDKTFKCKGSSKFPWYCICLSEVNQNFSTIASPLTECLRKKGLYWGRDQQDNFETLKQRSTSTPIQHYLILINFLLLKLMPLGTGISGVLSQENKPIELFSQKLSTSRQKWPIYEQEFNGLVRALKQWEHSLIGRNSYYI